MSGNWHLGLPGVNTPDVEGRLQFNECCLLVASGKAVSRIRLPDTKLDYTFDCVVCGEIKHEGQMSNDPDVCESCTYSY